MSMTYGGREGFAAVLTGYEWVDIWNKNHGEDDQVEDVCDAWEMDGAGQIWDEGVCCDFGIITSSDKDVFDGTLGEFGQAIDANPDDYDGTFNVVATFFAPKQPSYFKPVYKDIDELVDDIIGSTEAFVPEDHGFVREHLAMVSIVSYA